MKRIALACGGIFSLILLNLESFAQQAVPETVTQNQYEIPQMFFEPVTYIFLLMGFIILMTILILSKAISVLTKELEEKVVSEMVQVRTEHVKVASFWSRLMASLSRSVPIEKEKDIMLDHNYDGIQELDNQLPPWWKYGFYLTIVFAFVYLTVYHVSGTGKLQVAEYEESMQKAEHERLIRMEHSANYVTEENVKMITDPGELADAKDVFLKNCASCHGSHGEGGVGPNLTDDFWIHGGGVKNIFRTIAEGVPAKGMISWKSQMAPKKIAELSSYILTLYGTKPIGAKEPQGEKGQEVANPVAKSDGDTLAKVNSINN